MAHGLFEKIDITLMIRVHGKYTQVLLQEVLTQGLFLSIHGKYTQVFLTQESRNECGFFIASTNRYVLQGIEEKGLAFTTTSHCVEEFFVSLG
ncbi:hypothetical protein Sps_03071 [Shewanella psychrophila]|uniref:Uncharacterized protein n=1 Tax=Shewanella psychrophila TaxID=225848 RepID=A0A1S6HRT9_9GAMM|nr:hypothetical protein Sps_03071 [Shewanella psychrophila]